MAAGSAPYNGGFARLDTQRAHRCLRRRARVRGRRATGSAESSHGCVPHRPLAGLGDGEASYLASDLSYDYVRINAEYTT